MKFNYTSEKKKFGIRWEKLEQEYIREGMSEGAIEEMRRYDWEQFKKERVFRKHNQYMPDSVVDGEVLPDDQSCILGKYMDRFTTYIPENPDSSRYGWIEDIANEELYRYFKSIPKERLELITLYVIEEKTQEEIGNVLGIGQAAVARRISRIKNNIEKILRP